MLACCEVGERQWAFTRWGVILNYLHTHFLRFVLVLDFSSCSFNIIPRFKKSSGNSTVIICFNRNKQQIFLLCKVSNVLTFTDVLFFCVSQISHSSGIKKEIPYLSGHTVSGRVIQDYLMHCTHKMRRNEKKLGLDLQGFQPMLSNLGKALKN